MKAQLLQNISTTFSDLRTILNQINETEIDIVPFEGSWTLGQVAEHIIKSTEGMENIASKNTIKVDRDPSEKLKEIEDLFLNFEIKMKSPEFIIPTQTQHDKNEILETISKIEKSFISVANKFDLTLECQDFGIGELTIYELLSFGLVHTKRHTWQLKNILPIFNDKQQ